MPTNDPQLASEKLVLNAERVRFGIKKLFNEDFGEDSQSQEKSTDTRQPTQEEIQPKSRGKATFMSKNSKSQKDITKAQSLSQERSFFEQISVPKQEPQQQSPQKNSFSLLNKSGARKNEVLLMTQQQRDLRQKQVEQQPGYQKIGEMRQRRAEHLESNDIRGHGVGGRSQGGGGQGRKGVEGQYCKVNGVVYQFEEEYLDLEPPNDFPTNSPNISLQGSQAIFHHTTDKPTNPLHQTSPKKHQQSQQTQDHHPEIILSKMQILDAVKVPTQNNNDSVVTMDRGVVDVKSEEVEVTRFTEQKSRHEKGQNKPSFESVNNNQLLEMLEANKDNNRNNESLDKVKHRSSSTIANEQQRQVYDPVGHQTMPPVHQLEVHPMRKSSRLGNQQQTEYSQKSKPQSQHVEVRYESQSISDDSRQVREQVHGNTTTVSPKLKFRGLEPLVELPKAEDQPQTTIVSVTREEKNSSKGSTNNSHQSILSESGTNMVMEMKPGLAPVLLVADRKQMKLVNRASVSTEMSPDRVSKPVSIDEDPQTTQVEENKPFKFFHSSANQEQNLNQQSLPESRSPINIGIKTDNEEISSQLNNLHSQEARGYETNVEISDSEREEMINGILGAWNGKSPNLHRGGMWHAKRYKRCPRFSIYLQGDRQQNLEKHNYISLNQKVIEFLANENNQNEGEPITSQPPLYQIDVLNEPYQDSISGAGMSPLRQKSYDNDTPSSKRDFQVKQEPKALSNSKRAFYAAIPTEIMSDPFNKVLLSKGIDNALLTSYRTLSKKNNTISQTLKVIHNKFTPVNISNKRVQQLYKKAQHDLYPVSEQEEDTQVLVEIHSDRNPIEIDEDTIQQHNIINVSQVPSQQLMAQESIEKISLVNLKNEQSFTPQEPVIIGKIYTNETTNRNSTPSQEKMTLEFKGLPTKETESTQRFATSPDHQILQSPLTWQTKQIQIEQTQIPRVKKGQEKVKVPSNFVLQQKPGALNKQIYLTINGHTVYDETEPKLLASSSQGKFKNQQQLTSSNNSTIGARVIQTNPSQSNLAKIELNSQSPYKKSPISFKMPFYQRENSIPEEGTLNIYNGDIPPHLAYGKYEQVQPACEFASKRNSQPVAYGGERFEQKKEFKSPMAMTQIQMGRNNVVPPVSITQEERAMFRKFGLPEIKSLADEEQSSLHGQSHILSVMPLRAGNGNYQDSEVATSSIMPTSTLLPGTSQMNQSHLNVMEVPPISASRFETTTTLEQPSARSNTKPTQCSNNFSDRENKPQPAVTYLNHYLDKTVMDQQSKAHDKAFSKGRFNPAPAVAGFTTADSKVLKRKVSNGVLSQVKSTKKKPTMISSKVVDPITPVEEEKPSEQSQSQNQSTIHSAQQSMNHSRIYLQSKDIDSIVRMQKEWQADSQWKFHEKPLISQPDVNSEINNSLDHPQVMNPIGESHLNSQKADALMIEMSKAQMSKNRKSMDVKASEIQKSKVLKKATSTSSIRQKIPIKDKKFSRQTDKIKGPLAYVESTEYLLSSQERSPEGNLKDIGYQKKPSPRLNHSKSTQQDRKALLRASISSKDLTDMQKIAVRHITPNKEIKVGAVIDHLYAQEKKNVYAKAYVREECFGNRSVIFALDKTQNLGQAAIIKRGVDPTSVRYTSGNEEDLRKRPLYVPRNDLVLLFGQKAPLLKKKDQTSLKQGK